MSRSNVENLTERERACLEHLRQAQELGLSFAEYCRTFLRPLQKENNRAPAWTVRAEHTAFQRNRLR